MCQGVGLISTMPYNKEVPKGDPMSITYETAERAAGYYCAVRALEDELEAELRVMMGEEEFDEGNHDGYQSHPDWDNKSDALTEEWALTDEEDEVLGAALDAGLCDYFRAEDVLQALGGAT